MSLVKAKLTFKEGKSISNILAGDKNTVEAMVTAKIWDGVAVSISEKKEESKIVTLRTDCRRTTYVFKNDLNNSIYINFIGKSDVATLGQLGSSVKAFGNHKIVGGIETLNAPFPQV
jgi:hypothetical protein